jgi:hypothetical protein
MHRWDGQHEEEPAAAAALEQPVARGRFGRRDCQSTGQEGLSDRRCAVGEMPPVRDVACW